MLLSSLVLQKIVKINILEIEEFCLLLRKLQVQNTSVCHDRAQNILGQFHSAEAPSSTGDSNW